MSDSTSELSSGTGHTAIPDLLGSYRTQREALLVQSQNLARLREQIRTAAEHEAQEIVNNARREIREILVKARRELLVLAAQVQAASEPEDHTARALGDLAVRVTVDAARIGLARQRDDLDEARDAVLDARQSIHAVLGEFRSDLERLSAESHLLRAALRPAELAESAAAHASGLKESTTTPDTSTEPAAASSPVSATRRVGRPEARRAPVPALIAAALGVLLLASAVWLIVSGRGFDSTETPAPPMQQAQPEPNTSPPPTVQAEPVATVDTAADHPPEAPQGLTLALEAVRDVWVRTTIDGRADAGRLMRSGDKQSITAARAVTIRAGDAGALLVSVNGGEPARVGRDGQVVTRRFGVEEPVTEASPPAAAGASPAAALPQPAGPPPAAPAGTRSPAPVGADADAEPPRISSSPEPATSARPEPSPPVPAPPPNDAERQIVAAAERWFDTYYRSNGTIIAVAGASPSVLDERSPADRLPPGLSTVERTFSDVRLQLVGNNALFTARMTERADSGGTTVTRAALVSQIWMRRDGVWRLIDVRLISVPR
jgi:F0F1-type ATP synthase membrane subunit b/b'